MPHQANPEALLAHDGFLRGLATCLVADPPTADDLVQETYAAALSRPPSRPGPIGGWLATVMRNAARRLRRSGARRERAAARAEAVPSPEEVLEQERARREVVEAVLRLDPPHQEVVLPRFYEGLPPREVARRLARPVETVRTRTRRAIERLRGDLERRHGGRGPLLALLGPYLAADFPPPPAFAGGVVMGAKARVVGVGVLLLVAMTATWPALDAGRIDRAEPEDASPGASGAPTGDGGVEGGPARLVGASGERRPVEGPAGGEEGGVAEARRGGDHGGRPAARAARSVGAAVPEEVRCRRYGGGRTP